jgi:hypothetical protein
LLYYERDLVKMETKESLRQGDSGSSTGIQRNQVR